MFYNILIKFFEVIMNGVNKSKLSLILSMFIFGTIGIFRRYIPLPSSILALARGAIGVVFLLIFMVAKKEKLNLREIKDKILLLCISGVLIGFNWILLFEAYNYTTVATATLCYYMAPVFVIIASPFLFKEKLTLKKILCVIVALTGMVLVSGVIETGFSGIGELKGVLLGLGAAVLYASVVLMNKKTAGVPAYTKTVIQLGSAAIVLLPYTLLTENFAELTFEPLTIIMLLVVGVVHTGWSYALYFGSMDNLKAQTVAIFSYIDPVVAIILSAIILKEKMSILGVIGAVLVLGSTLVSELPSKKK